MDKLWMSCDFNGLNFLVRGFLTPSDQTAWHVPLHPPPRSRCLGVLHRHLDRPQLAASGPGSCSPAGGCSSNKGRAPVPDRRLCRPAGSPALHLDHAEDDADYSTRWRLIKTRFSRGLPVGPLRPSHEGRQERGQWQRRFWERHIRNEANFAAHLRYCWGNPVKHELVEKPEDWPYSTVHRDIRMGRYGW